MDAFISHFHYTVIILLMMLGLYAMISKKNLIKKVIGMAIFQTAIIFFYIGASFKNKATIPIIEHHGADHGPIDPSAYANPLPHVLMLTAIVVGVATLGVALALIQRIFMEYGTIEEDEILKKVDR